MERFLGNRKDKDEEGSVIILVAVLMVVFLGMAALVVDLGADYVYKAKMQTACDTASRAAASALPDTTKATELAKYYMKENGFTDTRNVQVEFHRKVYRGRTTDQKRSVQVTNSCRYQRRGLSGNYRRDW